jgi:hypothetical protein
MNVQHASSFYPSQVYNIVLHSKSYDIRLDVYVKYTGSVDSGGD